ncbi:MAG: hypothetical protein WEE89_11275 [Gemmatimonadota bacterium]
MSRKLGVLGLLVLSMGLSSCALFKKREQTRSDEPVTLQVENRNWSDIVIYAMVNGTRTRLTNVGATRSVTIRLPQALMASSQMLELVLDPLGSRSAFRTGGILVNSGQRVRLLIENELRLTTWSVQ